MMTPDEAQLDLLIVGAGPAGLAAAAAAAREGLYYLVVEQGLIADTIFHYPVGRTVAVIGVVFIVDGSSNSVFLVLRSFAQQFTR